MGNFTVAVAVAVSEEQVQVRADQSDGTHSPPKLIRNCLFLPLIHINVDITKCLTVMILLS